MVYSISFYLLFSISTLVNGYSDKSESLECEHKQFTFSWAMIDECDMKPRGGTSQGIKNILDPQVHQGWYSIQEKSLSNFEKDRRAILAMAGPYRVSFDFLEIVGYTPEHKPTKPYQSWEMNMCMLWKSRKILLAYNISWLCISTIKITVFLNRW